jgi:hypothetical protein
MAIPKMAIKDGSLHNKLTQRGKSDLFPPLSEISQVLDLKFPRSMDLKFLSPTFSSSQIPHSGEDPFRNPSEPISIKTLSTVLLILPPSLLSSMHHHKPSKKNK